MGALMRKMCDLTGEKMNGSMEEIVRKLEEGTDPQELEDQIGDGLNLDEHTSTVEDFENSEGTENLMKSKILKQPATQLFMNLKISFLVKLLNIILLSSFFAGCGFENENAEVKWSGNSQQFDKEFSFPKT